MKTGRTITIWLLLLLFSVGQLKAQAQEQLLSKEVANLSPWYVGITGGVPFGISTFSSFGVDKTRVGFAGGLYGGYRFNPILSLEASATWSSLGMSADKHCANYWLGADGSHYYAPVLGMQGVNYSDLYSSVILGQYGVHLNVNVLGFFAATKESRWSVNISPAIYGVSSKATIKRIAGGEAVIDGNSLFHFAVGGDMMAEYRITDNLMAGVYTGITHLTGAKIDAMPTHLHNYNMTWESGIRIGWRFGKTKSRKSSSVPSSTVIPTINSTEKQEKRPVTADTVKVVPTIENQVENPAEQPVEKVDVKADTQIKEIIFPVIYFSFNRWGIEPSQFKAFEDLLHIMQENQTLKITITGYTDSMGSDAVNKRIASQRAESVKKQLVKCGVAADRISTKAYGVDKMATDAAKARRTETKEQEVQ